MNALPIFSHVNVSLQSPVCVHVTDVTMLVKPVSQVNVATDSNAVVV